MDISKFIKGQRYQAKLDDDADNPDIYEFIFLTKNSETEIWVLDCQSIDKSTEHLLPKILELTAEQIREGEAYFISEDMDENIYIYTLIDGKWHTIFDNIVTIIKTVN